MVNAISTYSSSEWDPFDLTDQKHPIFLCVSGLMTQTVIGRDFLGDLIEQKFHIEPYHVEIIPGIPCIPRRLRSLVHPQVAPQQFSPGFPLATYTVNLDANSDSTVADVQQTHAGGYTTSIPINNVDDVDDGNDNGFLQDFLDMELGNVDGATEMDVSFDAASKLQPSY